MVEILSRKELKARKKHRCDTCHGDIMPGENHVRIAFANDGKVSAYRQHIHCEALAERYCMAMGEDRYDSDDVEWWAQEEVCSECGKRDEDCDCSALTCPTVLRALLPPTLLTHEDVCRHISTSEGETE